MRTPALVLLIAGALLASAAGAVTDLVFAETEIRAEGVTPGADAAFFSVSQERGSWTTRIVPRGEILTDGDRDGDITMYVDTGIPTNSLWAVVDLATGEALVAGPEGSPYIALELPRGGDWTAFLNDRIYAELAVLRSGVGGWRWAISDGGRADGDLDDDGRLTLDLTQAVPIPPTERSLTTLLPGDVIIAIDPRAEEYVALALTDDWF